MNKNDFIEQIFINSILEYSALLKDNFNGKITDYDKTGIDILLFYSDNFSIVKINLNNSIVSDDDIIIKNNKKYYVFNIYDTNIYIEPYLKYEIIKLSYKLIVINTNYNIVEIYNINGDKIMYNITEYINILSEISSYLNGKYEYLIESITLKLNKLLIPYVDMALINEKIINFNYSNNCIYDINNKIYYNLNEQINKISLYDTYILYNSIDSTIKLYSYLG